MLDISDSELALLLAKVKNKPDIHKRPAIFLLYSGQ